MWNKIIQWLLSPGDQVMLDLETMGTQPGCPILSIGAVLFRTRPKRLDKRIVLSIAERFGYRYKELVDTFYITINQDSCAMYGLLPDLDTIKWWENRDEDAKAIFKECENDGVNLHLALIKYRDWLMKYDADKLYMWSNGADFDSVVLRAAYTACAMKEPWNFYNNRCYRTLKKLYPEVKIEQLGTKHNALDDALSQTFHAIALLKRVN